MTSQRDGTGRKPSSKVTKGGSGKRTTSREVSAVSPGPRLDGGRSRDEKRPSRRRRHVGRRGDGGSQRGQTLGGGTGALACGGTGSG